MNGWPTRAAPASRFPWGFGRCAGRATGDGPGAGTSTDGPMMTAAVLAMAAVGGIGAAAGKLSGCEVIVVLSVYFTTTTIARPRARTEPMTAAVLMVEIFNFGLPGRWGVRPDGDITG